MLSIVDWAGFGPVLREPGGQLKWGRRNPKNFWCGRDHPHCARLGVKGTWGPDATAFGINFEAAFRFRTDSGWAREAVSEFVSASLRGLPTPSFKAYLLIELVL